MLKEGRSPANLSTCRAPCKHFDRLEFDLAEHQCLIYSGLSKGGRLKGVLTSHHVDAADSVFTSVIESDVFRASPVLRSLLLYLWKNRYEQVSEYAIATEALGRPPDFDPKTDATVRVHIARLRTKLKELSAKGLFPLQLAIPVGSHQIQWSYESAPVSPSRLARLRAEPYRFLAIVCCIVICGLLGVSVYLAKQNRELKTRVSAPAPPLPRFWRSFLANGKQPTIVMPSPVYFRWPNNIVVRDFAISDYSSWPQSDFLRQLSQKWGPPSLMQVYVSVLDMEAGMSLQHYLEQQGLQPRFIESRNFQINSATASNTIFLGVPRTTDYLKQLFERTNFYYSTLTTPVVVRNRNPQPGESDEYRQIDYSADHKIYPELIILLPAGPDGGQSLILFGFAPMALTSMLQSRAGLQLLDAEWKKGGSPNSWEMLVQAEVNAETVLKVWPTSIRAIPATFWNSVLTGSIDADPDKQRPLTTAINKAPEAQ